MVVDGKNYNINDLRNKLPKYDMFFPREILPGSHEDTLDKDPIGTTNPNLHMRFDSSEQIKRGEDEFKDRRYLLIGLIGTNAYSFVEKFIHDEEDTELSELP